MDGWVGWLVMTVVQLVGVADGLNESGTYQWLPEDVVDEEDEDDGGSRHD